MKQYIYRADEVGLNEWPSGTLRLPGIEETRNPDEATIFVCPGPLLLFQKPNDLDRFTYIHGREAQHIFFDCSDYDTIYDRRDCVFIRCNLKRFMLEAHPNSIAWSWPVEDFSECIAVPDGGFLYDVSFQGWEWSDARKASLKSCRENESLKCDFSTYTDFFGYLREDNPELTRRRSEFRRSMRESRIALCPQSIDGCLPYRFYEALSAGRVPLLVGSDYNLPFADEIPYSDFIYVCPAEQAHLAEFAVESIINNNTDAMLIEKGKMARSFWESHLDSRNWPALMAYAVKRKMQCPTAA
jgi:hypothetical protein